MTKSDLGFFCINWNNRTWSISDLKFELQLHYCQIMILTMTFDPAYGIRSDLPQWSVSWVIAITSICVTYLICISITIYTTVYHDPDHDIWPSQWDHMWLSGSDSDLFQHLSMRTWSAFDPDRSCKMHYCQSLSSSSQWDKIWSSTTDSGLFQYLNKRILICIWFWSEFEITGSDTEDLHCNLH